MQVHLIQKGLTYGRNTIMKRRGLNNNTSAFTLDRASTKILLLILLSA